MLETILEAVRHSGSDRAGWEAGGISEATYYRWQQEFQEFRELLAKRKQVYRLNCSEKLKLQATKSFEDYLFNGVEEVWTTHETIQSGSNTICKEIVKKVKRGVPQWAIERVLGKPVDELEAVKCLVETGWLPSSILEETSESLDELRDRFRAMFFRLEKHQAN